MYGLSSYGKDSSGAFPKASAAPIASTKNLWRNFPTGSIKPSAFIPWNNAEPIVSQFFEAPANTNTTATIAYDIGAVTFAVSASATSTNVTSTIAYDVGAITFAASANVTAPTVSATVSYDIGAVNFASTASVGVRSALAYDIGSVDFAVNSLLSTRAAAAFDIGSIDFSSVASVGNSSVTTYDIGEIEYLIDALNREDTQAVVSFDIGSIEYLVSANFMMAEPERSLSTRNVTFWGNSPYFNPSRRI